MTTVNKQRISLRFYIKHEQTCCASDKIVSFNFQLLHNKYYHYVGMWIIVTSNRYSKLRKMVKGVAVSNTNANISVTVRKRMIIVTLCVSVAVIMVMFLPSELSRRLDVIAIEQSNVINGKVMAVILKQEAMNTETNNDQHTHYGYDFLSNRSNHSTKVIKRPTAMTL